MPRFRLIPREERFFEDFQKLAQQIHIGARMLEDMLASDHPVWDKADEIKEVEHKCDVLTHQIIERLNRTFITPFDREDVHSLGRSLDDVMDAIDAAASVMRLYKINKVLFGSRELAKIITASTERVLGAMGELEGLKGVQASAVEINRLENEADRMHQAALGRLFDEEKDPINIIKWKEILDFLEAATDRCEDVANVLEAVVVKHG